MYNPPDRHYILSNENGIATGLLILPSESQDSGCTVRCAVIRNGLRVVTTRESTIYVGGKFLVVKIKHCTEEGPIVHI